MYTEFTVRVLFCYYIKAPIVTNFITEMLYMFDDNYVIVVCEGTGGVECSEAFADIVTD